MPLRRISSRLELASIGSGGRSELMAVAIATAQSQAGSGFLMVAVTVAALKATSAASAAPLLVMATSLAPFLLVRTIRKQVQRRDPRVLLVAAECGGLVGAVGLAILLRVDQTNLGGMCVLMFVLSAFSAVQAPATREWGSSIAPNQGELAALNSVLSMAGQIGIVIGWTLGGVLVGLQNAELLVWTCAATYAASIVILLSTFAATGRAHVRRRIGSAAEGSRVPPSAGWRTMLMARPTAFYTYSLISQSLLQRLSFSMFIPLVAGVDGSRSWAAGAANGAFALASILGAVLLTLPGTAPTIRRFAPGVLAVSVATQIVFGLFAWAPAIAIAAFSAVGVMSVAAIAIQSEAQELWRSTVGAGDAFTMLAAVQGPLNIVGSLILAMVLMRVQVDVAYVACVALFGVGSAVFAVAARRSSSSSYANHPVRSAEQA